MNIISVIDGQLYQWDTGRKVCIRPMRNTTVNEVHFSNSGAASALVVLPSEEDGEIVANIPNVLLQTAQNITVFAVMATEDGERTVYTYTVNVAPRQKPEDYVYTETEVLGYAALEKRISAIEKNGVPGGNGGTVDPPSGSGGGLTAKQINALDGMFKIASYTKNPTSAYAAFRTAFGLDHTHEYTSVVTTPATCATAGVRTHTCACGESYIEEIPATGHSWDAGVVTVEPTEDTEGVRTYTCTVCGETKTETIPVLGHEHSYTSTVVAPTCTEQGYTEHTCSCGDSYKDSYVDATGHNYVDGVCTVCGAVDPDYKPPVTLTGISATYSGGDVPVGTAVSELTGIVVTATYSDGSTKRVTGYTLSGEIGEGSNTITVTYEGMTTTIVVNGYDASKIVTIVNGFLGNTTTATSAPAANSSFPYAWAMSNAIPVNAGDTITAVVEPSNANSIGNVRIRVYNADGSYKESSTSQNGKVYNVHTSTVDGYVRIANTNFEACELVSVVVENSEGSTTYSVVDQR